MSVDTKEELGHVRQSPSRVDSNMGFGINDIPQVDEIDFMKYWNLFWNKRWLILAAMLVSVAASAVYAYSLPNIYRAEVLLAPVMGEGGGSTRMSGLLGKLGGLASMAGVSMPQGNLEQSMAVLKSREFLWKFYKDEKLKSVFFPSLEGGGEVAEPSIWSVYRLLSGIIDISEDKMTNLITLAVVSKDPDFAAQLANQLVVRLNEYVRQQEISQTQANLKFLYEELKATRIEEMRLILFELIKKEQQKSMLVNTRKQFVFKVVDAAIAPDHRIRPQRSKIVLQSVLITGLLTFMLLISYEKLRGIRKEGISDKVES